MNELEIKAAIFDVIESIETKGEELKQLHVKRVELLSKLEEARKASEPVE
jgi:hypothetical protein